MPGIPILPDNSRSILTLANSHTHQGYISQDSFQSDLARMDCKLWHPPGDHNWLWNAIPVIPFHRIQLSSGVKTHTHDGLSSLSQRPFGQISSISKNLSGNEKWHKKLSWRSLVNPAIAEKYDKRRLRVLSSWTRLWRTPFTTRTVILT